MSVACASSGHIVLTVATSQRYAEAAVALAESVRAHGVAKCVALAATSRLQLSEAQLGLLEPIALPQWVNRWRAERDFCADGGRRQLAGWRLTHILKTQALLLLLSLGVHVLCLDADRRLVGNPMPALRALADDVAGMRDTEFLNFGLVYLRASAATIALIRRVANRTLAAWDQAVFNEELGAAASRTPSLHCCFANAWVRRYVVLAQHVHDFNKDNELYKDCVVVSASANATVGAKDGSGGGGVGDPAWQSRSAAGETRAAADSAADACAGGGMARQTAAAEALTPSESIGVLRAPAQHPPLRGRLFRHWRPLAYNELSLSDRRFNHCTRTPCAAPTPEEDGTAAANAPNGSTLSTAGAPGRSPGGAACVPRARRSQPLALTKPASHAIATRSQTSVLRCTLWPSHTEHIQPDAARCLHGNKLRDGYTYVFNAYRGTPRAVCGQHAQCTCCRRPKESHSET